MHTLLNSGENDEKPALRTHPAHRLSPTECTGRLSLHGRRIRPDKTNKHSKNTRLLFVAAVIVLIVGLLTGGILVKTRSHTLYGAVPTGPGIRKLLTDEATLPNPSANISKFIDRWQRTMQSPRRTPFDQYIFGDTRSLAALLAPQQHYNITKVSSTQALQMAGKSEFPGIGNTFKFNHIAAHNVTKDEAKALMDSYMATQFPNIAYKIYGVFESEHKGHKVLSIKFEVDPARAVDFVTGYAAPHPDFKGFPIRIDNTVTDGIPLLHFTAPPVDPNTIAVHTLHNCSIKLTAPAGSERMSPTQLLEQLVRHSVSHLEAGMQHWLMQLLEVCEIRRNPGPPPARYTVILCNTASADILRQMQHILIQADCRASLGR